MHKWIAECCEKISHHEFKQAEQERKILQEESWRQQQDFREVHFTIILLRLEELRKFQSSTFDTHAKLIEDRNTISELSGRVQELQNEVKCMSDSEDLQDAESVRSGNSHVTSQPMSFPKHPVFEGLLRPSFVSPQRKEGPPNILAYIWYIRKRFCQSASFLFSSLSSRIELSLEENF